MTGTLDDDDDGLAAEYVLGVLALPDRLAAETRAKTDAVFADRINSWENRLSGLNDEFAEAPAPDLLPVLEARLFPKAAPRRKGLFGIFGLLGGAALAAVLAIAVIIALPDARQPTVLATMSAQDSNLVYRASYDDGALTVTRVSGDAAPAGQVHELWIIAPGASPVSLGLLAEADLSVEHERPPVGWTLAVTVEPEGGSPIEGPTGPVVAASEIGV